MTFLTKFHSIHLLSEHILDLYLLWHLVLVYFQSLYLYMCIMLHKTDKADFHSTYCVEVYVSTFWANLPKLWCFLSFQWLILQAWDLFFNDKCADTYVHAQPAYEKLVIWYMLLSLFFSVMWLILYYFEYLNKSLEMYWLLGCTDLGKVSLTSLKGCDGLLLTLFNKNTIFFLSSMESQNPVGWKGPPASILLKAGVTCSVTCPLQSWITPRVEIPPFNVDVPVDSQSVIVHSNNISLFPLLLKTENTQFFHLSVYAMYSRNLYMFLGLILVLESDSSILMVSCLLQ